MTRKTNRKTHVRKNDIQKAGLDPNTAHYWGMPGYVHRLYVDRNPMINKVAADSGIASKSKEDLEKIITQTKNAENNALEAFAKVFGGATSEEGERILTDLVKESSNVMTTVYRYLADPEKLEEYWSRSEKQMALGFAPGKREGMREDIANLALELFSNEDPEDLYGKLEENLEGLIRGFVQEDGKRKGKMAVSRVGAATGSLFERLVTAILQKKYIDKLKEGSADLVKWNEDNAISASTEALQFAHYSGKEKATKIGYEVEGKQIRRGQTEKSYDLLIKLSEEDFLPIQIKAITKEDKNIVNIITKGTIRNFINYSNTTGLEREYLQFALIHQHYFADQAYAKAVKGVQNKLNYKSYDPSSAAKATAIEMLDEDSTMTFLRPAIEIMKSSVIMNYIRGVEENPRPLFYLTGKIEGGQVTGGIIRMSEILEAFKQGRNITISPTGSMNIAGALENYGKRKKGILTREEWYTKTKETRALTKLKVTMSFNYGKQGNIGGI